MSDSWELICDHTYTGIPGVVVDSSPSAASYGQTLGLDDTDFLKDGAAAGSGAVRFYKPGKPEKGWRFWSAREAGVHYAVYRFADMASLNAALKSDAYKALAVDFDRSWPAVARSRDVLDLVQESDG